MSLNQHSYLSTLISFCCCLLVTAEFYACTSMTPAQASVDTSKSVQAVFDFSYQLNKPDTTFYLPKALQEISGLSTCKASTRLYAVQDEDGIIYTLDIKSGEILKKTKFHKEGDYEGIEIVNEDAYVIKSSGTIYQVKNFASDTPQMLKYNDFLSSDHDVEGLAYDWKRNQLLLSCKAHAVDMKKGKFKKPIYAFDLKENVIKQKPPYIIELKDVKSFLKENKTKKQLEKFDNFFDDNPKELYFSPSAIAIHPFTGNIYISSSIGKLLMVLDGEGNILAIEKLKKKVHPQPEGLAFDAEGNLYISNEGKDDKARIQCFFYDMEK